MLRLVLFLLLVAALATGLSWLADRPGLIVFNWEGYEGEISVFHAVVGMTLLLGTTIFLWSILRSLWTSPAQMGRLLNRRRQKRGLDALSSGMIAIGAGDKDSATRYAIQARKSLPNEPLTHLLRAQAAQLSGDKGTARRIFEAMLASPDTEQLGLRGLFLEAEREGEREAATQFAERALKLNPKLGWSVDALFDLQCKGADWQGALETVALARKHGHIDKLVADRRRAVLLTAQAQAIEGSDPERALQRALEAHNLAPGLVPAAAIAGRILAARGNTPKATKVIQKTWLKSPHPDLAIAYAHARLGDSPRDRLDRVRQLAQLTSNSIESPIAVARAAIEAQDFAAARSALEPLLEGRMTQRVATLMARIEHEQHADKGRVREWLARAVNAPRDPVWTADGVTSETWEPVSPVTGQLDAFQWRVPVESMEKSDAELLAQKLEEFVALGAPLESIEGTVAASTSERDVSTVAVVAPASEVTKPATVAPAAQQATPGAAAQPSTQTAPAPATAAAAANAVEPRVAPAPVASTASTPAPSTASPSAASTPAASTPAASTFAASTPAASTPAASASAVSSMPIAPVAAPVAASIASTDAAPAAATVAPPGVSATTTSTAIVPSGSVPSAQPVQRSTEAGKATPAGGSAKTTRMSTGPSAASATKTGPLGESAGGAPTAGAPSASTQPLVTPPPRKEEERNLRNSASDIAIVASDQRPGRPASPPEKTGGVGERNVPSQVEAKIFVSPRAPDDPGPDGSATDDEAQPPPPRRSFANR